MFKKLYVSVLICILITTVGFGQIKSAATEPLIFEETLDVLDNLEYTEIDFNKMKSYFKATGMGLKMSTAKSSAQQNHLKDFNTILSSTYFEASQLYGTKTINALIYSYYQSVEIQQKFDKLNAKLDREIDSLETLKSIYTKTTDSLSFYNTTNTQTVLNFIEAYNKKDSIATMQLLHPEFSEYFNTELAIKSKTDYAHHFAWGKVMNDNMEVQIVYSDGNIIELLSTYHCDRDKLLKIEPYKSIRKFEIKDDKIYKIIESEFPNYKEAYHQRQQTFQLFFDWALEQQNLKIMDFKFNQFGAETLKKSLTAYSKKD
ncbi:hypothetical protein HNV08_10115 [Winogradskyella eckloniae]|uniref:hypothetical protein n=1 Tax=Winogradskyella eckloniae TaxID=1089306 RepID=UPI001563CD6D|nr:hypothetical protein [Winogradskyella eckloniae]NRD20400.1 hypothetical protein [Winogradskyella eckloniae]